MSYDLESGSYSFGPSDDPYVYLDHPATIREERVIATWDGSEVGPNGGPVYRAPDGRVVVRSDHNDGTDYRDVPAASNLLRTLERTVGDLTRAECAGTDPVWGGEGNRPAAYRAGLRYAAESILAYLDALPPLPPLDRLGYVSRSPEFGNPGRYANSVDS